MSAVNVVADKHEAAVMILQGVAIEEIDLFGLHPAARLRQLQERRPGAITGGAEYEIAMHDRSGNARGAIRHARVAPQELSGPGIDADAAGARSHELDVLPDPSALGNDDR